MIKDIFKKLSSFITFLVMAIALFLIIIRILGYKPYAIISTSMSPNYKQGDVVYTRHIEFNDLEKGDTITFIARSDSIYVTHRVIDIDRDEELIYTKGDNNLQADMAPVKYSDVLGKVVFKIPLIGYVSTLFMTSVGKYIYVAAIIILLVLLLIPKKQGENHNGK